MRYCIRCQTPMIEDVDIKVDMTGHGVKITTKGVFGDTIQKPKVAVCSSCGEISMYLDNIDKLMSKTRK